MRKKSFKISNALWMRITAGLLVVTMLILLGCEAFADEYTGEQEDTSYTEESIPIPFTEAGNGEVQDQITNDDSKEFYTVKTADGNTFYLVIDNARSSDNVYMLAQIADEDLESFTGSDAVINIEEDTSEEKAENADLTAATADSKKGSFNTLLIVILVLGAILVCIHFGKKMLRGKDQEPVKEGMEFQQGDTLATENEDKQNEQKKDEEKENKK